MNPDVAALIKYRLEQSQVAIDDAVYLLNGNRSTQGVVNRAYYAMFYAALALLQKIGKAPSKHTGVISIFDTEFVAKGIFAKELSKDLHRAFEERQIADYKVIKPVAEDEAREAVEKTAKFVEAVKAHLALEIR
jgi:uncharacterized protein (UPF0332 family)